MGHVSYANTASRMDRWVAAEVGLTSITKCKCRRCLCWGCCAMYFAVHLN